MVRLTQAQKDHRGRRRGGKTRNERLAEKIRQHKRHLRENNLSEPQFHVKPIRLLVEGRSGADLDDYAVYGIYKDGSEWVLTGLAATDDYEKMARNDRTRRSTIEVRGRYVLVPVHSEEVRPERGVEIGRYERKKDAMSYVSADGSHRIEAGRYLIRPSHDPRTLREEVDKPEFRKFREDARKVWTN